ncbi:serine/threonine-protein kinase [Streptomyces apocyni]|uniref:serine/threonine-protein kinase n=1 Tax=Streptomyces apocyni TaxID=2654677 RepID=UPI0012EADFA9|nr:serine/threonine-protein kinase [Streptomyces apocyni]
MAEQRDADGGTALHQAGADRLQPGDPHQIGPYAPLGHLGSGGMGRVYLARPADNRSGLAAVKVIRPEFAQDAEFRRRFEREASVLARVRGTHAPRLLDTGFDGDLLWMATDYLPGLNLSDAVREHGLLAAPGAWRLLGELGQALAELSAAEVVHRDLKPSNVILSGDGAQVIDFGISQATDSTAITTTGKAVGTPAYMSPERLREGRSDATSDVFSLACTLVFAATGRAPFGDGTGVDVMHRVAYEDPDREVIGELAAVDPALASLLSACLAKEPSQRPTPHHLIDAAAARPRTPQWQEPLGSHLAARRQAYEVLKDLPVERTVHLRLPSPAGPSPAPPPPAPPGFGPPLQAPAQAPMPAPAQAQAQAQAPAQTPAPGKRRKGLYLSGAAGVAVCAVALTAFVLTRPDTGTGTDRTEAAGTRSSAPADDSRAADDAAPVPGFSPDGSDSSEKAPGDEKESGKGKPDQDNEAEKESDGEQGGESAAPQPDRVSSAPSSTASRTSPAQPGATSSPTAPAKSTPTAPSTPPWLSDCTHYSGTQITHYGHRGQRVLQVQCMLSKRGYSVGGSGVDGEFGEDTRSAVRLFQSDRKLAVDGEVGPNTWSALRDRT